MSFGPFDTQTASSVTTCQSGVPPVSNTAIGVMVVISRFTPGVATPGGGGSFPFFLGTSVGGGPLRRRVLRPHTSNVRDADSREATQIESSTSIESSIKFLLRGFYSASVAKTRFGSMRINFAGWQIGHPHCTRGRQDRSPALAMKLLHHVFFLRRRVDASERKASLRHPQTDPSPNANQPSMPGTSSSTDFDHLVGLGIDAVQFAVFLAEHPDRAIADTMDCGVAETSMVFST